MANCVENAESVDEMEQQQSFSWVDRIEKLEVKKNSL